MAEEISAKGFLIVFAILVALVIVAKMAPFEEFVKAMLILLLLELSNWGKDWL